MYSVNIVMIAAQHLAYAARRILAYNLPSGATAKKCDKRDYQVEAVVMFFGNELIIHSIFNSLKNTFPVFFSVYYNLLVSSHIKYFKY